MRLIDADALRQKIENWKNDADKGNLFSDSVESFAYDEVLAAIDVAPTIIQRPAASWVLEEDFMGEYYVCSRCERKVRDRFGESAYLPALRGGDAWRMSMENGLEALAKAISDATASFESLIKAIRQSETQCGYIKPKHTRPVYGKGKKPCDGFKANIRTREVFRK